MFSDYWVAPFRNMECLASLSKAEPEILAWPEAFNETLACEFEEAQLSMPTSLRKNYLRVFRGSSNIFCAMRNLYVDYGWRPLSERTSLPVASLTRMRR